tara:strand:- start:579 stop:1238 length:660 start_codon:yes stop_codon:yes gene_type:complete
MNKKTLFIALTAVGLAFFACKKEDLSSGTPVIDTPFTPIDETPIVSDYYFTGKIDSQYVTLQDSIQDFTFFIDSVAYGACDTNKNVVGHIAGFFNYVGSPQNIEIKFLKCEIDTADSAINVGKFSVGAYPFGSSSLTSLTEGVEISYTTPTGVTWKTLPGTGANTNQSFQIFQIDTVSTYYDTIGEIVITGTMNNIRLFNGVKYVPLDEAEFKLPVGKL